MSLSGYCGRLNRKINWDPKTQQIVDDSQAQAFIARDYREGFGIELG